MARPGKVRCHVIAIGCRLAALSQSVQPVLRGFLRQTPLAEFFVQAYDSQLEGTLLLQTATREKSAILFVRGAPAKARPASNLVRFGRIAQDLEFLSAMDAKRIEKQAQAESRHEAELVRAEGLMDETALFVTLREQLTEQVLALCGLPDTTGFGFYKANYLAQFGLEGSWRVKPLHLLWRGLVDHLPETRRDAWLARLGGTVLKMRAEAPVSRYGLRPTERTILDILRAKPVSLSELLDSGVGAHQLVKNVVCGLMLSRQLELGSDRQPVGLNEPPETPNSVVPVVGRGQQSRTMAPRSARLPSITSMAPGASRAESLPPSKAGHGSRFSQTAPSDDLRKIIQQYQARGPQTHYEVLGIERGADAATIRSAFFQLAKVWHPDRLPQDLKDLKSVVGAAFAKMGEAHQTLADDARRAEYDRALSDAPDDERAQVAAVLDAAHAFQRAEILMKKKDFVGAMKEAKTAYEADSTQADYAALYGWLQGMNRSEGFDDLIRLLDKALEQGEDNVRALWYRGQLLKKAGHQLRALKDFKKIVQLKPNHVDAQRELRVHAMRKKSTPRKTEPTGLFGRFKKKD